MCARQASRSRESASMQQLILARVRARISVSEPRQHSQHAIDEGSRAAVQVCQQQRQVAAPRAADEARGLECLQNALRCVAVGGWVVVLRLQV